jgi:hypothetical protein
MRGESEENDKGEPERDEKERIRRVVEENQR